MKSKEFYDFRTYVVIFYEIMYMKIVIDILNFYSNFLWTSNDKIMYVFRMMFVRLYVCGILNNVYICCCMDIYSLKLNLLFIILFLCFSRLFDDMIYYTYCIIQYVDCRYYNVFFFLQRLEWHSTDTDYKMCLVKGKDEVR